MYGSCAIGLNCALRQVYSRRRETIAAGPSLGLDSGGSMAVIELARRTGGANDGLFDTIAVFGGGAWGAALAAVAARAGRDARIWARDAAAVGSMNAARRNPYLPDIALPAALRATADLRAAAEGADAALVVAPSAALREVVAAAHAVLAAGVPICVAAKGVERESGLLMSEVAAEAAPGRGIAVLSGPSFADEVARDLPTAVVIASACLAGDDPQGSVAARLAQSLGTESFRPYVSDDVIGVEVGGAVKNVIAIACGMAQGAGFGLNARAALITRGLDEIKNLAEALGGRRETVTGLSGMGDLALTASDPKSRNFAFGLRLGRGEAAAGHTLVEGAPNALSVTDLARARGVEMPICEAVRRVVHEGEPFAAAFRALWTRPIEAEPRALDLAFAHPAAS
jgi:glycerol-3-phosphate dehydrogenase (NAD(P)+)